MEIQIKNAMEILEKRRPLFHSEADFQFEVAWELKTQNPKIEIRMERPFSKLSNKKVSIESDIIIIDKENSKTYGIELKYVTKALERTIDKEEYDLKSHAATNLRRYDYYKDISRLEELKENKLIDEGYAIFLTNVASYLNPTKGIGSDFNFSNNHIIEIKRYFFKADSKISSIGKERNNPIEIKSNYNCNWIDYSKNYNFKYILVKV